MVYLPGLLCSPFGVRSNKAAPLRVVRLRGQLKFVWRDFHPLPFSTTNSIMSQPLPKRRKLTALAEKYTHPTGITRPRGPDHSILNNSNSEFLKSRLTPLEPGLYKTESERARHEALEK